MLVIAVVVHHPCKLVRIRAYHSVAGVVEECYHLAKV